MNSEIRAILFTRKGISSVPGMFFLIAKATLIKIKRKFTANNISYYPSETAKKAKAIKNQSSSEQFSYQYQNNVNFPFKLKLATGYYTVKSSFDWKTNFDDPEQYESLHRWGWLIYDFSTNNEFSTKYGYEVVRSWLKEMTALPKGLASGSYSVGERISNLCLFAKLSEGTSSNLPPDLKIAISDMAFYLAQNIEYHPDGMTGNHVINNARALIYAGIALQKIQYVDLAKRVIDDNIDELITEEGFLREGSSHYQFLFTRWLLEIKFILQTSDVEYVKFKLNKYIRTLLKGCMFFVVKNKHKLSMVTIGDVSPDFEPDWLLDLIKSKFIKGINTSKEEVSGWAKLFVNEDIENRIEVEFIDESFMFYKNSGWLRLAHLDWVVIMHFEDPGERPIASHSHHDYGSLILFYKGNEVLIDPGRFSYMNQKAGFGEKANSHTLLLLNGIEPMLSRRDRFLPKQYRKSTSLIKTDITKDVVNISIMHDGFSRTIWGADFHIRNILIKKKIVTIEDKIEGKGSVYLNSYYQWSDEIVVHDFNQSNSTDCATYSDDYFKCSHESNQKNNLEDRVYKGSNNTTFGWRFPKYGCREPSITHEIHGKVNLPIQIKYNIEVC